MRHLRGLIPIIVRVVARLSLLLIENITAEIVGKHFAKNAHLEQWLFLG